MNILRKIFRDFENKKGARYLGNFVKKGLKFWENVAIVSDYFFDSSHCFLISIGDDNTMPPNVRLIAHDTSIKKYGDTQRSGRIQ